MSVKCIDSFLVRAARGTEGHVQLPGSRLNDQGRLFDLLERLFDQATRESRVDILFRPAADDGPQEDCQALLMKHLRGPTSSRALALAQRLSECTGNSSGLGLLFVICGMQERSHQIVLTRFPADQGVLAEQRQNVLQVEFIEKVFMKSANAYKSAVYRTSSLDTDIWRGKVVDKQMNGPTEVAQYWIGDFLNSELATTGAAGTRRLAIAIRKTVRDTKSDEIRTQLIAASQLIPGLAGKSVSSRSALSQLAVSVEGIDAIRRAMGRDELIDERFRLSAVEFASVIRYRTIELSNGATLTAEVERFDQVFTQRRVAENVMRYSTEGSVVHEHLRKRNE